MSKLVILLVTIFLTSSMKASASTPSSCWVKFSDPHEFSAHPPEYWISYLKKLSKLKDIDGFNAFIVQHSRKAMVTNHSVDGHASHGKPEGESGLMHKEMHFYLNSRGERVVMKVMTWKIGETDLTFNEILAALAMATQGGPQVAGFGQTQDEFFFIEMEEMFPNQKSITLKALSSKSLEIKQKWLGDQQLRAIARLFANAFNSNIIPRDYDFIFSDSGEVRWIDSGKWYVLESIDDAKEASFIVEEVESHLGAKVAQEFKLYLCKEIGLMKNQPIKTKENFQKRLSCDK